MTVHVVMFRPASCVLPWLCAKLHRSFLVAFSANKAKSSGFKLIIYLFHGLAHAPQDISDLVTIKKSANDSLILVPPGGKSHASHQ